MTFRRVIQQPIEPTQRICTSCGSKGEVGVVFYTAKVGSMNFKTYGCAMPCKGVPA